MFIALDPQIWRIVVLIKQHLTNSKSTNNTFQQLHLSVTMVHLVIDSKNKENYHDHHESASLVVCMPAPTPAFVTLSLAPSKVIVDTGGAKYIVAISDYEEKELATKKTSTPELIVLNQKKAPQLRTSTLCSSSSKKEAKNFKRRVFSLKSQQVCKRRPETNPLYRDYWNGENHGPLQ
jgi:hypothetical protein